MAPTSSAEVSIKPHEPCFPYRELKEAEFRVLYLLPGVGDDPITFRLEHHSLDDCPEFEAISYCWGDGGPVEQCNCWDGDVASPMFLTANLWQVLRHLRDKDEVGALWADQICINQSDDVEKAHQIYLMARIYSQAVQVIAWLGEADHDTDIVFDLFDDILAHTSPSANAVGDPELLLLKMGPIDAPEWVAARKIFERPWFSRVW